MQDVSTGKKLWELRRHGWTTTTTAGDLCDKLSGLVFEISSCAALRQASFMLANVYKGEPISCITTMGWTFTDVSTAVGISGSIGKGMGVAIADYDGDGWMDIFVANDNERNFLFKNRGGHGFDEVGVESFVAYTDNGVPVSSMGVDFRDWDNNGKPSLFVTALGGETFPLFHNEGNGFFSDDSYKAGIGFRSFKMSGWGAGIHDFDNDGYKDLFSANSHVSENADIDPQQHYRQANAVFRNLHNGIFKMSAARQARRCRHARLIAAAPLGI